MRVCIDEPKLYYNGRSINNEFDIVIPRIDIPYTEYGLAILRQFQAIDVYCTDIAYSIELGRDKLRCLQYLMRKDIPLPTTGFGYSKEDFDNIIKTVGGTPLIIKLIEGTEGIGVFLAENIREAKNILNTFKKLDARIIVQEFVQESSGQDCRSFVVGDKIVANMKRQSQNGDFRANVALGACSFNEVISTEEENLIFRAVKAIGINIAGVDFIRSKRGPLILEINTCPGFAGQEGIEEVTGINVAGAIIDYAIRKKHEYDKGKGVWLQQAVNAACN